MIESRILGLGLAVGLSICVGGTFYDALTAAPHKPVSVKHETHYAFHDLPRLHHAKHREVALYVKPLPPLKHVSRYRDVNAAVLAILEPEYTATDQKSGWYQMVEK